ncbi:MAG: hypothetical protein QM656_09020 [Paracoccaceae bacterium]
MPRLALAVLILALAACQSGPHPGIGIGIGPHGASVYPRVSGNVGGVGVSVGGAIN